MTFEISYIIAPLVGGCIGYITNDIAIRMLFRPHQPKYLFGVRIPFTPGIIPKEKGRIATALGDSISANLMNKDVLQKNLLSDEMTGKIRNSIDCFFERQKKNPETLLDFLLHYLSASEVEAVVTNIQTNLTHQISNKLNDTKLGDQIADAVIDHISAKLRIDGLDIGIPNVVKSMMGKSLWERIARLIEKPAKKYLASNINQMLNTNGTEIVSNLINHEIDDISSMPMQQLLQGKDEQIVQFTDSCLALYRTIITDHLPRILNAINIPAIIESRINEMNMAETETLIFQVLSKELKAIVLLGALLGFIMGSINILI